MKTALKLYRTLLSLYPRRYRQTFGEQICQTFIDHYADVEATKGCVSTQFWTLVLTDELQNIVHQHRITLREENAFFQRTVVKHVKQGIATLFFFPLYGVFYAVLVKVSLGLPHPHVHGIGVLAALAALLLIAGAMSLLTSYVLARAGAAVFSMRKKRTA